YFFHAPATTEICPLSLHDALPISRRGQLGGGEIVAPLPVDHRTGRQSGRLRGGVGEHPGGAAVADPQFHEIARERLAPALHRQADRKSTRLNSSHVSISYAVFCLK